LSLSMMPGCTSGRLVCMTTSARRADYYLSVRSPMPVAQLQEQFPPVQGRQSRSCQKHRQFIAGGRSSDAAASCAGSHSTAPGKPVFQPRCLPSSGDEMLQSGTCMFYVPGMLGEPELELFAVLRT
jgi:type VI secretion system protein ImpJ